MADEIFILYPHAQWEGCLSIVCHGKEAADRFAKIEGENTLRKFRVRAILADAIPLTGDLRQLLKPSPFKRIRLQQDPQLLYLHHGGMNAVFYRFVSDGTSDQFLLHIEVVVETTLPRLALYLGRTAINRLLDAKSTSWQINALIARIDVLAEGDLVIASELVLPYENAVTVSQYFGGMHQSPLFTPWLSTMREALASSSPFWRFLCAWRTYEGIATLRKRIREQCQHMKIDAPLPKDIDIDADEFSNAVGKELLGDAKKAGDLFARLQKMRDGVSHFVLKEGTNVDFSDARLYSDYSVASTILLKVAYDAVKSLHKFYEDHIERRTSIGSILPEPHHADKFFVRHPGLSKRLSDDDFR